MSKQDHSKINTEYLKRVQLLEAQIEQLRQYHNPQKRFKAMRLADIYESFLDSIYTKLNQKEYIT